MRAYRKQALPSVAAAEIDYAWAAGFLEGEGSFCGKNGTDPRPRVSAGQRERDPLQRLFTLFGGAIYDSIKQERPYYTWLLRGQTGRDLMLKLLPLMSVRRQEQIRAALAIDLPKRHSRVWLGKHLSPEHRMKISAARREYFRRGKKEV